MHTYAAESTLPGAGWGLFARRMVGPSNPEDDGDIVGEYYGREMSLTEVQDYKYNPNPSINTGFMITFQGLAIDAWNHQTGCYMSMSALINDCLNSAGYNSEWVKKVVNGICKLFVVAHRDVDAHDEFFIEYGNLAFCRASFPTEVLFKALSHYYNQIMKSPQDKECWSKLPQARYLFNSPYHTCSPTDKTSLITRVQRHFLRCNESRCTCDIQTLLSQLNTITAPLPGKKRRCQKPDTKNPQKPKRPAPPIPDSDNSRYDSRLLIQPATELQEAGNGLYATTHIKEGDIIGIYENAKGGKRLTSSRIKDPSHSSEYAIEYEGLVRDAWDPILRKPCCKVAQANDACDATKDNATLGINPNFPMTLLMLASKDIPGQQTSPTPIYLPHGAIFWCDDRHPIQLHLAAIRRYNIDIHTSTEDTDGDWRALHNYEQLCILLVSDMDCNPPSDEHATHPPVSNPTAAKETSRKRNRPPDKSTKTAKQRTLDAYITTKAIPTTQDGPQPQQRIVSLGNPAVYDMTAFVYPHDSMIFLLA